MLTVQGLMDAVWVALEEGAITPDSKVIVVNSSGSVEAVPAGSVDSVALPKVVPDGSLQNFRTMICFTD